MTRFDLIYTLNDLSREFSFRCDFSNLALIRGDILCELPKLISMTKGDVCYICFRPMGFECEPNISRLQDNPLVQHSAIRESWKVSVDEYGFWQMSKLVD